MRHTRSCGLLALCRGINRRRHRDADDRLFAIACLHGVLAGASNAALDGRLRTVLAGAIQSVFWLAFGASVLALAGTALAPGGRIAQLAARRARGEADGAASPVVVAEM